MTGSEFSAYLNQKIDKSYSSYFDNTKLNRLVRESIFRSAEKKYLNYQTQKTFDELWSWAVARKTVSLITGGAGSTSSLLYLNSRQIQSITYTAGPNSLVTVNTTYNHYLTAGQAITLSGILGISGGINGPWNIVNATDANTFTIQTALTFTGTHTANSGIFTTVNMLTDYYHYLYSKGKINATAVTITNVKAGTSTAITAANHRLRVGDAITIAGVVGISGINSAFTVSAVYSVDKFAVAVSTTGTYTSGGTVTRQVSSDIKIQRADQKAFVYSQPTEEFLKAEMSDNILFLYPNTVYEVTIDYLRTIPHEIDVADNVVNLELYYPAKFLYYIADECALNAGGMVRDGEIQNTEQLAIQQNP